MPIWIKYGGKMILASMFTPVEVGNSINLVIENEFATILVEHLTEQQAKDLMREIVDVVAAGGLIG